MTATQSTALKISAVLWVAWGLVHFLAGVSVIFLGAAEGFQAIADDVDPAMLQHDYHPAVAGVLDQHGWNLAWGGAATVVGAVFVWRANLTAIWVTAMLGGFLDLGYFIFVDIPGFVKFFPGSLMTMISGSAIILSFYVYFVAKAGTVARRAA